MTDGFDESESQFKAGKTLGQNLTPVFLATSVPAYSFPCQKETLNLHVVLFFS